ncbi:tetratricopeptide repeat protein [Prevotella sp. E9-3]|uniref:tetratricopeptide repeat protein n=1 Tax=Prevotella sp. E9-3 TaxID=2913621 RepID=UPI001EDC1CFB|nr:tetratricopeptide repeat protein [Prevotella sp. E9-3]UKK47269.1 tetratricopeptide repeat protein [Prevotella sp. E9-3]
MEIAELIKQPEQMDRDTLYELRSTLAMYPYFQTVRLLMLQNLYLLHDPTFDEELRRAAIYITDRKVLFQLVEAGHYQLQPKKSKSQQADAADSKDGSRTISLINDFLDSIPKEGDEKADEATTGQRRKRKPTPADAAVDYVAYLLESESEEEREHDAEQPQLRGISLIDSFIENDKGKIVLNENPTLKPEIDEQPLTAEEEEKNGYYTETLARIYIKQGRYSKALEIISRLSLQYPKKNAYFADQIRFLQKLIINNNKK